ncbi:hypothetical protein AC578_3817 [Pseudocercospora eumusae]|uniref:Uncharacterized protein n=1 Tax=Pseudocercospora eumusae TaxID=321146 RepID=A0A139HFL5_9PEZI|nr:hypothetical protein AC578_3817 [Pseudocercospora eumusae]
MPFPIVLLPKTKELKLMPDTSRDEVQAKIYDSCDAITTTIKAVNDALRELDGKAYQFSPALRNWRALHWEKLFCGSDEQSRQAGEPRWTKSIRVECTILEVYQRGFWADHTRSGEQAEFTAAVCALFEEARKLPHFLAAERVTVRKKIRASLLSGADPWQASDLEDTWRQLVGLRRELSRTITSCAGDIARVHGFAP